VIALLGAFLSEANEVLAARDLELLQGFDVMDPLVFFGLIVGSAVPAVFSALLMLGVNRNAERMVAEIHRQFETMPGIKEGKTKPDYACRCASRIHPSAAFRVAVGQEDVAVRDMACPDLRYPLNRMLRVLDELSCPR